jgi:hypothetical protein
MPHVRKPITNRKHFREEIMKKRLLRVRNLLAVFIGIFLLLAGNAVAQDPEGEAWLRELEAATDPLSVNVEGVQFAVDSFFDVFVEAVLREGLPDGVVDPALGGNDMFGEPGTAVPSEVVTQVIREMGPELFLALRAVDTPTFGPVDLTPGAAVYKYDKEGRWSRGPHTFNIYTWVKVNQWIRAAMNKTKIVWKVFKPGIYSTDCMYLNIHSNGDMRVTLANNGPLAAPDGTAAIPTLYGISEYIRTPQDLVLPGVTMAGARPVIDWVPNGAEGSAVLPPHILLKVWNAINVGSEVAPGTYSTGRESAVITVFPTF